MLLLCNADNSLLFMLLNTNMGVPKYTLELIVHAVLNIKILFSHFPFSFELLSLKMMDMDE